MSGILSRFLVKELHGNITIDVSLKENKLILIGENGMGKTIVINFIYFFLTNQWPRMLAYEFKSVLAVVDGEEILFTRDELLAGKEMRTVSNDRVLYIPTCRRSEEDLSPITPELTAHLGFKDAMKIWRKRPQNEEKKQDMREFVALCNQYFVEKEFVYDDSNCEVHICVKQNDEYTKRGRNDAGKKLDLNMLSSGEKEMISLFSWIYLPASSRCFVIIDEPEFSLSFHWQQRLLPDIIASKRCSGFIVITHAPSICHEIAVVPYLHSIHEFVEGRIINDVDDEFEED